MNKVKIFSFLFILIFILQYCRSIGIDNKEYIPKEINDLVVKVTAAGNEYFNKKDKTKKDFIVPSQIEKKIIELIPPNAKVSGYKKDEFKNILVTVVDGADWYYYTFSSQGNLINLRYKNYETYKDLRPGKIILRGSKKNLSKSKIPNEIEATIVSLPLNESIYEIYTIESAYGIKYLVTGNGMAYFIHPSGQLQAAGLIKNGALNENDSSNNESLKSYSEVINDCNFLLKKYKKKFNVFSNIKTIKKSINPNSSFRFIVIGDNRSDKKIFSSIIEHISLLKPKPLFIVNTGDMVAHGYAKEYADYFIPVMSKNNIPFLVSIGNHDDGVRDSTFEFQYLFGKNTLNYYFDTENYRFIMFDNASRINGKGESLPWLEKVLKNTPLNKSKIVFSHKPPAVLTRWAWHAWDKKNSEIFVKLMRKFNVKHVFLGHIHGYSTATIDGIDYTVTGGGGAPLRNKFGKNGDVFHYIICDAMPDGTIKQKVVKFYENRENQ